MSELSDLEKEILAEGEKAAAWVRSEALKLRQSKIGEELKQIEAELNSLAKASKAGAEPKAKEKAAEPVVEDNADAVKEKKS